MRDRPAQVALSVGLTAFLSTTTAWAGQNTPPLAEPSYPIVSIGTLTYVQYAFDVQNPEHFNAFDLTRGYVNINADLNPGVSFRLTPDIRRAVGGPLDGSLVIRLASVGSGAPWTRDELQ